MNDPTRRRFLAGLGSAGAAALAGCAGVSGDLEFDAGDVAVPESVLADTGYEAARTTRPVVTRPVEVLGVRREVRVTNVVAEFDRAVDLSGLGLGRYRAAVFAALSTPQVSVLGRTFNPVGEMSADDLVALLQEQYTGLRDVERVGTAAGTVAGVDTTVGRYEGRATLSDPGVAVDVALAVSEAVAVDGDFLVTLGVAPTALDEREAQSRLMAAVRHG